MRRIETFLPVIALAILVIATLVWISCEQQPQRILEPATDTSALLSLSKVTSDINQVMAIQNRNTDALLKVAGVIGTATAAMPGGEYVIKVLTKDEPSGKNIPAVIENVPVITEAVGEIVALSFTGRYRPVTMGVSGGNINDRTKKGAYIYCSGGTIGSVVYKSGNSYFLSNNHVFARENKAVIGEDIVQPGLIEVNCSQITNDVVADLSQFVNITFKRTASNKVDAAIAQIRPTVSFTPTTECAYTPSSTIATASLGLQVKKCGRTSEYTEGQVTGVNVTVLISYSSGTARFINQIQFSAMSEGGDSGSLIVTRSDNKPVALLFAGSSSTTIGNPIQEVMNALGVNF
ncbi:MAG: S1 family peptidase [candidate division KSB1 bacterium]|nr:S1 family peptidase [candidate division KSB1 bacterium]